MAASGAGSLTAALWLAFNGRAKPLFLGIGAAVLGAAEIVLGFTTVYAFCLTADVRRRVRRDPHGHVGEHDHPAERPGRPCAAG